MTQDPYRLDQTRRAIVLESLREVCAYRGWRLLAAHVRTNHVHVVVDAPGPPEKVMNTLKAYSSRRLTEVGLDPADSKRWSRHGSTRYLWRRDQVEEAIVYVADGQGEVMAVYVDANR